MPLNIKSPEVDRLARELATATGESLTTAVETALRERLDRTRSDDRRSRVSRRMRALRDDLRQIPVVDGRSAGDIIGYDEHGLPA